VFTAEAAEEAYESIRKLFRYEITERLVLVVHNSHNEFQQTNVIAEYLDEASAASPSSSRTGSSSPSRGTIVSFAM